MNPQHEQKRVWYYWEHVYEGSENGYRWVRLSGPLTMAEVQNVVQLETGAAQASGRTIVFAIGNDPERDPHMY